MNDYDYPGTGPCADYEFEIAEWLDGELSPEEQRSMAAHIEACDRCARLATEFRRIGRTDRKSTRLTPVTL